MSHTPRMSPRPRKSFLPAASLSLGLALGLGAVFGGACGGPNSYMVQGSGPATGADAKIEVEQMEGGSNKMVRIDIENLPPPDRLGDDLSVYVVWFVGDNTQNAGVLAYDADERKGRLQATSSMEEFEVIISAEESPSASSPGKVVVVRQEVD